MEGGSEGYDMGVSEVKQALQIYRQSLAFVKTYGKCVAAA